MNRWTTTQEMIEFILDQRLVELEREKHGNTGYTVWRVNDEE